MRLPGNLTLPLLSLLLLVGACEKSVEWELTPITEPILVVEAILTNEDDVQKIRLSQTYAELNSEPPPVTNAVVSVEANGVVYSFATSPSTPGLYHSQSPFAVVDHLIYTLTVRWEGGTYTATSTLAGVAPIPAITFAPVGDTDSLRLGNFVPAFDTDQQSMYEVDIDWSHLNATPPNQAKLFLYTFSELHVSQFILPPSEVVSFPKGSIVTVTKYGLNEDFATYLRAKAIETSWNHNFFYSTPENPPTNISNGGLGFFSACSIVRRTVVAE